MGVGWGWRRERLDLELGHLPIYPFSHICVMGFSWGSICWVNMWGRSLHHIEQQNDKTGWKLEESRFQLIISNHFLTWNIVKQVLTMRELPNIGIIQAKTGWAPPVGGAVKRPSEEQMTEFVLFRSHPSAWPLCLRDSSLGHCPPPPLLIHHPHWPLCHFSLCVRSQFWAPALCILLLTETGWL